MADEAVNDKNHVIASRKLTRNPGPGKAAADISPKFGTADDSRRPAADTTKSRPSPRFFELIVTSLNKRILLL